MQQAGGGGGRARSLVLQRRNMGPDHHGAVHAVMCVRLQQLARAEWIIQPCGSFGTDCSMTRHAAVRTNYRRCGRLPRIAEHGRLLDAVLGVIGLSNIYNIVAPPSPQRTAVRMRSETGRCVIWRPTGTS